MLLFKEWCFIYKMFFEIKLGINFSLTFKILYECFKMLWKKSRYYKEKNMSVRNNAPACPVTPHFLFPIFIFVVILFFWWNCWSWFCINYIICINMCRNIMCTFKYALQFNTTAFSSNTNLWRYQVSVLILSHLKIQL